MNAVLAAIATVIAFVTLMLHFAMAWGVAFPVVTVIVCLMDGDARSAVMVDFEIGLIFGAFAAQNLLHEGFQMQRRPGPP